MATTWIGRLIKALKAVTVALLAGTGVAFVGHNLGFWREAPGVGMGAVILVGAWIAYLEWFRK